MTAVTHEALSQSSRPDSRNRLFSFLIELRRRRVCRAITMYSVAMWLICQIVDVISPALELPEWTLKLVIVLGLLGLPVIILMSWLFEITPDGLVIEGPGDSLKARASASGPKHIADRLIDCSLILAAMAIGVQLGLVALGPPIEAAEPDSQRISVAPFRAVTGDDAASVSDGIVIDLQHVLVGQQGLTVTLEGDARVDVPLGLVQLEQPATEAQVLGEVLRGLAQHVPRLDGPAQLDEHLGAQLAPVLYQTP